MAAQALIERKLQDCRQMRAKRIASQQRQDKRQRPMRAAKRVNPEFRWGDYFYANSLESLNIKYGISLTPLNCERNAFTLALKLSADAFVLLLLK